MHYLDINESIIIQACDNNYWNIVSEMLTLDYNYDFYKILLIKFSSYDQIEFFKYIFDLVDLNEKILDEAAIVAVKNNSLDICNFMQNKSERFKEIIKSAFVYLKANNN